MRRLLHHYFVPHSRNNHRSKLLHHSSLFILTILMLVLTFAIQFVRETHPAVLGISYSISENDLLTITNQKRAKQGLPPLTLDPALSAAAVAKASDMYSKNYWAHFAPDGTTPWLFIRDSGYSYIYAGENLAKGFRDSNEVVTAWMNSPSHRDNMLSSKYSDVGFAVVPGTLLGEETVLVVEMLGAKSTSVPTPNRTAKVQNTSKTLPVITAAPTNVPQVIVNANPTPALASVEQESTTLDQAQQNAAETIVIKPLLDALILPKSLAGIFLSFLLLALVIDLIVIERKKIFRVVGHNIDHIILLIFFIVTIVLSNSGSIF